MTKIRREAHILFMNWMKNNGLFRERYDGSKIQTNQGQGGITGESGSSDLVVSSPEISPDINAEVGVQTHQEGVIGDGEDSSNNGTPNVPIRQPVRRNPTRNRKAPEKLDL